jgi:hypothetical protein
MVHRKEPTTFAKRGNKATVKCTSCRWLLDQDGATNLRALLRFQPTKCCQNLDWRRGFLGFRGQQNMMKITPWIILQTMQVHTHTSTSTTPMAATWEVHHTGCPVLLEAPLVGEMSWQWGFLVKAPVESHLLIRIVGRAISFKGHWFGFCSRCGGFDKGASARECGTRLWNTRRRPFWEMAWSC